jgi:hypothetical protein
MKTGMLLSAVKILSAARPSRFIPAEIVAVTRE